MSGNKADVMIMLQVAAGLKAELNLELYAIAVGVEGESGVGTINHELVIVTETDILKLPITADILLGQNALSKNYMF